MYVVFTRLAVALPVVYAAIAPGMKGGIVPRWEVIIQRDVSGFDLLLALFAGGGPIGGPDLDRKSVV